MPYDYLTINENKLNQGVVSASYFPDNLQSLYEQKILNEDVFYGESDDDLFEFTLYNNNQEFVKFNRIIPRVTYSVIQGSYRDINNNLKTYKFSNPFTNIVSYDNRILLHSQFDLKSNEVSPGLYYLLYNPIRNIAGNYKNKLVIKEISPSRTELRLSYAFDPTKDENSRIDSIKISAFANKKYIMLRFIDDLLSVVKNNPIEKDFVKNSNNINLYNVCQKLGFKNASQLQEFINSTYVGFDKISFTVDESVLQTNKFVGISQQINNFIYTYNEIEFTKEELLEAFRIITLKVSQDRILQKTSLNDTDLTTVLQLFETVIYTDWLLPQISILLENYKTNFYGYYKNALNFDNGELVKILNHTSYINPVDGKVNVQIKLDEPLSLKYNIKSTCWISNISIAPLYFKVNLFNSNVSRKIFLNDINFDVELPIVNPTTEKYSDVDVNTLDYAKIKLKQKYVDLYINYNDFGNFINYSSAELRTKIAKSKISQYYKLNSEKLTILTSSLNSSPVVSSSYSNDIKLKTEEQIKLLNSFDEYESYLFYNTSSINEKIDEAVIFDSNNYNGLVYQLPSYVKEDTDSADYIKFTAMIGHFFDNILVFIKKFPKVYPITNDDNNHYPKNYIDELLNSFNWDINIEKFAQSNLNQLYFSNKDISGYNSSSYFDYTKAILNRLTNNISSVYKTKGTTTSFEIMRTLFGIPSGLLNIKEYGSSDVFSAKDNYFVYDDIVYMTDFKENNFLKFNHTSSDFTYVTNSYYSTGSSVNFITSSTEYTAIYNGISTIEFAFRFKSKNYDYGDKIPVIKKIRNNKIDWQIYILKSKQQISGKLIFDNHPYELGNSTSSIILDELPLLNGNIYSVMLRRQPVEGKFDKPIVSSSFISNLNIPFVVDDVADNVILDNSNFVTLGPLNGSFTSSHYIKDVSQYIPYVYTLTTNQYDGSDKIFSNSKKKLLSYELNTKFGSGSYYIGNYSSSVNFLGNIDKFKAFGTPLSDEDFDEHSYNVDSISTPNKSNLYKDLYYLWSFDTPVNLYSSNSISKSIGNQNIYYESNFLAYNFSTSSKYFGVPTCSYVGVAEFPYQFDKINLKQCVNINNYGPNYKINSKINKIEEKVLSNFTPYDYSTKIQDSLGDDSILAGFYITPYNYLNSKIENFLGRDGIIDIIGDPENLTKQNYKYLNILQQDFGKINEKYIYPQEYYSTYKFYIDFSIFDIVKKLNPSRTNLLTGILLEPSLLERKKFNYRDLEISDNEHFDFSFDNQAKLTSSIINTSDSSSYTIITSSKIDRSLTDRDTYNYSRFEVKDVIDDRDFIYAKYGKFVNVETNGFTVRDVVNIPSKDYYQSQNNNGKFVTFTSSYSTVQTLGSGSGELGRYITSGTGGSSGTAGVVGVSQVTGSKYLKNYYKGENNTGYSKRHLSKFTFIGSRNRYQAVSSSKFVINNGVKTNTNGLINYYTYVKGKNDKSTTVNRRGLPNNSDPVITIPGFLSLNILTNNSDTYGDTTGSIGDTDSLFIELPLTASLQTSASLERYIMNL